MQTLTTSDNVDRKYQVYQYGASIIPDEDEMKLHDVEYGRLTDPMGHKITLQKCDKAFDRLVLNVVDLDESIEFFQKVLGWSLLRKRSNVNNRPKEASFSAFMVSSSSIEILVTSAYLVPKQGNEGDNDLPPIELLYHYSTEHIKLGEMLGEVCSLSMS